MQNKIFTVLSCTISIFKCICLWFRRTFFPKGNEYIGFVSDFSAVIEEVDLLKKH